MLAPERTGIGKMATAASQVDEAQKMGKEKTKKNQKCVLVDLFIQVKLC